MFELDETTGLRDYTVKYESKFSSGNYYYLFMSYGGLSGYGDYFAVGYQMRVFRSENPDGPYVDCLANTGRRNGAVFRWE